MDEYRQFHSNSLCSMISGFSTCWKGAIRCIWPWNCLKENWLVGVANSVVIRLWCYGLQCEARMLCDVVLRHLVHHVYGIVIVSWRHLGSANLVLRFSMIAYITLLCFLVWVILVYDVSLQLGWRLLIVLGSLASICQSALLSRSFASTMSRMHLYMLDTYPQGGMMHTLLMRLLSSFSAGRVEIFLYWVLPSVLLSLHLGSLYAHQACISMYMLLLASVAYKAQPVSMCRLCRLYFGMVGLSANGGWFSFSLMPLSPRSTTVWLILMLHWGLLSFWLSLLMVSLYAQMLGTLCSHICWHSAFHQIGWDEVKGQSLIVNEDAISETSHFISTTLTYDIFRVVWYFDTGFCASPCLQAHWPDNISETSGRVLGTRSNLMVQEPLMLIIPLSYGSRPSLMPLQVSNRVSDLQDRVLSNSTFMFWLYFDMCWVYMIAFLPLSIVLFQVVSWFYEVLVYLVYGCSLWFEWFVVQHSCVLGPCRMAHEQHPRMLGLARRGNGSIYLPCLFVVSHHGMAGSCFIALVRHRTLLETTQNGFGQCSGCVFLRCFLLFGSSYGLSSSETDYLALQQGYVVPSVYLITY